MPGARPRRLVGSLTALVVGLTGSVVLVSSAPAAAAPTSVAAAAPASVPGSVPGSAPVGSTSSVVSGASLVASVAASVAAAERPSRRKAAAKRAAKKRAAAKRATEKKRAEAKKRAAAKKRAEAKRRAIAKKRAEAKRKARAEAARRARWKARWAKVKPMDPRTYIEYKPGDYTPPGGPKFNNPYGKRAKRRALLDHVIATIDASPGYRLPRDRRTKKLKPCPRRPVNFPSTIKIAVYSIADQRFADAVIDAHRRCVSVQILMNSHLTEKTSPSWGRIARALGPRGPNPQQQRSFAHRCHNGCMGTSVLHSKTYLFSRPGKTRWTVITGSSNMTQNANRIQWNDLFTVNGNEQLFKQYRLMFKRMVPARHTTGPYVFRAGPYESTFYPHRRADKKTDSTLQALRTVRCKGAEGGTGIGGRTVVYVNMHAWFGQRGRMLTQKLRQLYSKGCYVRILYSFMGADTFYSLIYNTGPRMRVRRVLFSGPRGLVAVKYSHMKMFAVSGRVGSDRSARVVWTGSNNWTDRSNRADEVTLRIPSDSVYEAYIDHWKKIRNRRSTVFWAQFREPTGGGRAP